MNEENKQKLREFLRKTKIETASKEEAIFIQDITTLIGADYPNNKTDTYISALYFYIGNYTVDYNSEYDIFSDHSYKEATMFELSEFYYSLVLGESTKLNKELANLELAIEYNKLNDELEVAKKGVKQLLEIISKIATKKFLKKYKSK